MATPIITELVPAVGPSSGGDIVRLRGMGFSRRVAVLFGNVAGTLLHVREDAGRSLADVRTPAHPPALVDITLLNLDTAGSPVPGEQASLFTAYRFVRAPIVVEANLTRLVRALLRALKEQVLANTMASVALDYDDTAADGLHVVAMAKLPSLVLSGPRIAEDRALSTNVLEEHAVQGPTGPELLRSRPALTVDLAFTLTAASDRTAELFNLLSATATFLNRNRWLELQRDPADASKGSVRWEMDPDGEARTKLDGEGELRGFSWGLIIRGFDIDEGLPVGFGRAVGEAELTIERLRGGS